MVKLITAFVLGLLSYASHLQAFHESVKICKADTWYGYLWYDSSRLLVFYDVRSTTNRHGDPELIEISSFALINPYTGQSQEVPALNKLWRQLGIPSNSHTTFEVCNGTLAIYTVQPPTGDRVEATLFDLKANVPTTGLDWNGDFCLHSIGSETELVGLDTSLDGAKPVRAAIYNITKKRYRYVDLPKGVPGRLIGFDKNGRGIAIASHEQGQKEEIEVVKFGWEKNSTVYRSQPLLPQPDRYDNFEALLSPDSKRILWIFWKAKTEKSGTVWLWASDSYGKQMHSVAQFKVAIGPNSDYEAHSFRWMLDNKSASYLQHGVFYKLLIP